MTFTNLYKITYKQKWQLNAQRSTLCFKMLLLNIKNLTMRPRRGNLKLPEFTGVGLSLMKTSVLISTLIQGEGKTTFTNR